MPVTHSYCYDDYAATKIEHNHFTLMVTSLTHIYETLTMTLSHFILAGKRCSQTRLLRWQWLLWRWLWRWLLWRSWHHIDTTSPMQYARHSDFGLVPRAAPVILWHWWHTHVPVATAVTLVTHRQRHLEYCDDADFGDRAVTHVTQWHMPAMLLPPIQQNFLHGIASNKSRHCLIPRAWSENLNCVFGFVWSHLSQFSDREHQTGPTW